MVIINLNIGIAIIWFLGGVIEFLVGFVYPNDKLIKKYKKTNTKILNEKMLIKSIKIFSILSGILFVFMAILIVFNVVTVQFSYNVFIFFILVYILERMYLYHKYIVNK
ncbi:hypothetical protein CSCA_0889 [Clostridium scatologenes]|uniref:DUF3784 domain-containing protein n=1 Tax=Clostridium scatologenes TaxID=1548 RepID=A0A0E3JZ67_CLOSL|nr:hypothetical protein CSCA_0889 [Clostridium scatologenes]